MEMRPITGGQNVPLPAPSCLPKTEHTIAPLDSLGQSRSPDPLMKKAGSLSSLNTKGDASFVFDNDTSKVVSETLHELALWGDRKGKTSDTDVVYDPFNKAIYTGVEPKDGSNNNYWHLRAYNPDGTVKWTFRDAYMESPPVLDGDGNIYIRSHGKLHFLDKDGRELSSVDIKKDGFERTPPALGPHGEIYLVSNNPDTLGIGESSLRLYAFNEGKESWHYDAAGLCGGAYSVIVAQDGTVCLSANHHRKARTLRGLMGVDYVEKPALIGLDPVTGKEKFVSKVSSWDLSTKSTIVEGPEGTIYAYHGEKNLSAFTTKGKLKWNYTLTGNKTLKGTDSMFSHPPSFDGEGNMFIGTTVAANYPEGYLICIDKDGREKWNMAVPGGIYTQAKVGPDGNIYCVASGSRLMVFDKETGAEKARHMIGELYDNDFSFGDEGEIYLNTSEHVLALQLDPAKRAERRESELKEAVGEEPAAGSSVHVDEEFVDIDGIKIPRFRKL